MMSMPESPLQLSFPFSPPAHIFQLVLIFIIPLLHRSLAIGTLHSALIRNLIKLKGTAKLTAQGELVCLKDSKYILFEILANTTWKGLTSSYRPSKPDLAGSANRSLYGKDCGKFFMGGACSW